MAILTHTYRKKYMTMLEKTNKCNKRRTKFC